MKDNYLVDNEDLLEVKKWNWYHGKQGWCANIHVGDRWKLMWLGRFVAKLAGAPIEGKRVKHRDGNPSNCRRENLQIVGTPWNYTSMS